MSAAPRPATRPRFRADIQQIEQYFTALPLTDGAIHELAIGKTQRDNPAKITTYTPKLAWGEGHRFRNYIAATRPRLIQDIAHLIEKYGNVYMSRAGYRSPKRDATAALPSRILFFDDITLDPIYSMLVETSPGNYQGYIFLSEDADAETIRDLGERGAKALSGAKKGHADSCYDVTRLVRIPGSYNTKNGIDFPVRIVSITGKLYSVDELRAQWPAVERHASTAADLDWNEVAHCYGMLEGILKRIKKGSLTYEQLHGDGQPDRSNTRFGLACNLRKDRGYPDEEIAAILYKFHFGHLEEKGNDWLEADIERCIADANRLYPDAKTNISYCRLSWQAQPAEPLPQVERPKTGRRRILPDEAYLALLEQDAINGKAFGSQEERARELGVSTPTIRRIEARLKQAGKGERITIRKRGGTYSFFAIFSAIKTPPRVDIKDGQNAPLVRSTTSEEAQQHAENRVTPTDVGVTHAPPSTIPDGQAAPRPSLGQAVNAMRQAGAKNRKQLHRMLGEYFTGHNWSPAAIDRAYDAQRAAERRKRNEQRLLTRVSSMTRPELRKAMRSAERHIARSHEKQDNGWTFWLVYRDRCERQLQRTIAAENRRRRKNEKFADLPPALVELDPAAEPMQPEGLSGGVCSTSPQPGGGAPLVRSYVDGLRHFLPWGADSVPVCRYLEVKRIPPALHAAYIAAARRC